MRLPWAQRYDHDILLSEVPRLIRSGVVEFSDLKELVDRALADKVLTRAEQQQIMNAVVADKEVTPEEHALLESIIDKISSGEIKAVD